MSFEGNNLRAIVQDEIAAEFARRDHQRSMRWLKIYIGVMAAVGLVMWTVIITRSLST